MRKPYLETIQRGTPDLPFACYSFCYGDPGRIAASTHWHPEQEILYVQTGALEVMIGKNTLIVREKEICFVPPDALHSVVVHSPDTKYYALVFSYSLLTLPESHFFQISITEPLKDGRLVFPAILDNEDPRYSTVAKALDQMCLCDKAEPNYKFVIFQALITLYSVLQDALVPADTMDGATHNRAVKNCLDYMHAHYSQRITLEQLAKLVHLHPNYLCKLFKTYTGQTAFQQLIRIRLENAARLLEKSRCSVSQAAEQCGFESVSFFSRKFKQVMGCSPKEYRKPAGK